jgi:hypothetical protein
MTMLRKLHTLTLQINYNHLEISKYKFTPIGFHMTHLRIYIDDGHETLNPLEFF